MRLTLLVVLTILLTALQLRAAPTELSIEMIKQHEGYSDTIYKDNGNFSIGYGTNVSRITKEEAVFLLHHRLNKADIHLSLTYDWYNSLGYIPQSIVLDMFYNMGSYRFSKFRKMHKQLSRGNWANAALEMKDSLWYKQTKSRSEYLYNMMRNYKDIK